MHKNTVIVIVGPTAVGKTDLSVQLAKYFHTSIISADSRQCFIELNTGVAKPSAQQLRDVKHYFINSHHINEEVNAAIFERLSLGWCEQIFKERDVAIMVGGTGLYINAFTNGLDEVPPSSPELRQQIVLDFNSKGIEWLQQQLKQLDPTYYEEGEIYNPQRMMRALEVVIISGRSILSFRSKTVKERPFNIIKIGLEKPRELLYEHINHRVNEMIDAGLIEEARSLLPYREFNSLQTVGYRELFEYFDGKMTLEKSIEMIKQNTRHYAKRQLTWFKKDLSIPWFLTSEIAACIEFVQNRVAETVD